MPVYKYKALTDDGKFVSGTIEGESDHDARARLKEQKLLLNDLRPASNLHQLFRWANFSQVLQRFGQIKDLAMITRQIATLLKAGIPLVAALDAVIEQNEEKRYVTILKDVRSRIQEGQSFSEALSKFPNVFDYLYVHMVKAGEESGSLATILYRLSDHLIKQNRTKNKLVTALTYPAIMIIISILVVSVLLTYVVPQIVGILLRQKQSLPLPTQILVGISHFFVHFWPFLLGGVITVVILFVRFKKTKKGRKWVDALKLKIPILGDLFLKDALARFASTCSILLESGVPALEALRVSGRVTKNQTLMDALDQVCERVVEGQTIASPLKATGLFPPVVTYMIGVGEQTGQLPELLKNITESFEEDVEWATQRMLSTMEPLIIIAMAGVVAFIVVSILLPLMNITGKIG